MAQMTLEEAVGEVLNHLTGLDLHYLSELDRYRSITKHLNRALRRNATENEWSYYSSIADLGAVHQGQTSLYLRASQRPRIIFDDSMRLVDDRDRIREWAYWLPRESLHKYQGRTGLWVSSVRNEIQFSRPISTMEAGLRALVPVMREPVMLEVPRTLESIESILNPPSNIPEGYELIQLRNFHNPDIIEEWLTHSELPPYRYQDPEKTLSYVESQASRDIKNQLIDFSDPDLIVLGACKSYAATDPVYQPRYQTLEAEHKGMFYDLVERDSNHTDEPYRNEWHVPIQSSLRGNPYRGPHLHPHSDERNYFNYR